MKIRLDALDITDLETKSEDSQEELMKIIQKLTKKSIEVVPKLKDEGIEPVKEERMPNLGYVDVIDHVLGLITDKSMTSRDIQITIGRTREHTSRLMKKLFEDEFVERHTNTKPYTYSISKKGLEKLRFEKSIPRVV